MRTKPSGVVWRPRKSTTKQANVDIFGRKQWNTVVAPMSILNAWWRK